MAAIIRYLTAPSWPQSPSPASKLELHYVIGVQKHVPVRCVLRIRALSVALRNLGRQIFLQVSLVLEREEPQPEQEGSKSTELKLKITMAKGDLTRSIRVDPAEETLLVEFLRSAIATSFGFLPAPKAFW